MGNKNRLKSWHADFNVKTNICKVQALYCRGIVQPCYRVFTPMYKSQLSLFHPVHPSHFFKVNVFHLSAVTLTTTIAILKTTFSPAFRRHFVMQTREYLISRNSITTKYLFLLSNLFIIAYLFNIVVLLKIVMKINNDDFLLN